MIELVTLRINCSRGICKCVCVFKGGRREKTDREIDNNLPTLDLVYCMEKNEDTVKMQILLTASTIQDGVFLF